ncbi:HAD family hydrolase [Ktedonospora formicarum]|uniref:2-haloalkanoic acid dehalogenase n=1 Tax=Ktedonospora formicarum TaxID=2778364 RepID=A0A8J3HZS2_9CHLR|nr:HAD family hydrolase [Ktedonospora formicarum]GHO44986.1 2-haloalkanoic acid dehalogenase [Ktedonospora formicarum]
MLIEQPQAIRTVFFDAGYTLLTERLSTPELCQQVGQALNLHIHMDAVTARMVEAESYFLSHRSINRHTWANEQDIIDFWTGYYKNLLRPFVEEHDEERLHKLAYTITREYDNPACWQLYEDVLPTLDALKARKYTMGIISDWGMALGPILQHLQLTPYFDCVIISAAMRHAKPSPALYEGALQRANEIPEFALHIGDMYVQDVLGARSVGITPVLLDRHSRLQENQLDCLLVHSLFELLDLLEVPHAQFRQ